MGLLDSENMVGSGFNDALLAAAQALLTPRAQGGGIGAAFGAVPRAMGLAQEQQRRNKMLGLQEQQFGLQNQEFQQRLIEEQARRAEAERTRAMMEQYAQTLPPDQRQIFMMNPQEFIKAQIPKDQVLGPGAQIVRNGQVVAQAPFKPDTPPEIVRMMQVRDQLPDGHPWRGVIDQAISKSTTHAPGTQVSVKVDNKMGESVGAQVGPILKTERERTEGALNLGRSGQEIITAIDSGRVIAGPGASLRLFGAQVADLLGVGGKDNAEKLQNTRRVIRGLADAAVEARKRLAGQGQVTENEAKAVEKATSGNIDDLTAEEIRLIAGLNIKAARMTARGYQQQLDAMPESMRSARPFYEVPGLEEWTRPEMRLDVDGATAPGGQQKRLRFNPQTGKLE